MKKIVSLYFLLVCTTLLSQWKYPSAPKIPNDIVITYAVQYDRVLTDKEKASNRFMQSIVVAFNNDYLLEKTFTNTLGSERILYVDYKKNRMYAGINYKGKKSLVYQNLKAGKTVTNLIPGEKINLLNTSCDVYEKPTSSKKILTTKAFGIRYSKKFNCEGFLLQYMGKDKYLGSYTVTATKIDHVKLPENVFSLDGYSIRSKEEQKAYSKALKERKASQKISESEKLGLEAPAFSVRSINGKKFKSKNLKGKVIVVNFWFIKCNPCIKEMPELNNLKHEFAGKNVEFLAFALDEEYKIANFLKKHPFDYDIIEESRYIAQKFGVKSYPTNIIIDQDGKIEYYKSAYNSRIYNAMKYKIEKLLKQ